MSGEHQGLHLRDLCDAILAAQWIQCLWHVEKDQDLFSLGGPAIYQLFCWLHQEHQSGI